MGRDAGRGRSGAKPEVPADLARFCAAEYPRLVGALSLYCGERDLAQELAQEALARACAHWASVRQKDSPSAWTYRVAINLANSHFRRRAAGRRAAARHGPDAESLTHDPATKLAVRDAVAALPKREREVLVLRYFADFSIHDVAALMRCPEGTVKTLTHRGIERLRRSGLVDEHEPDLAEVVDVD
ncbi:MAG TPA: sigma-70 family RNA polymerase sigma factor [Acidimicrobiia bacterium]|jgi:RNA polymerase sigma-70 factor (sigma-E family)